MYDMICEKIVLACIRSRSLYKRNW